MTDSLQIKTTLGSIIRNGRWIVPDTLPVKLFMASAELDFRDAKLDPGITTLDVSMTMASLEIVVAPGMVVDVRITPFAGSVEQHFTSLELAAPKAATPAAMPDVSADPYREPYEVEANEPPSLRIIGNVRLASVEVITCLPGETPRDARRRERERRRIRRMGYRYS